MTKYEEKCAERCQAKMTELDERYLLALYRSSENPSKHVFGNSHFRLWRLLDRGCVALIPPRLTAVGMAAAQQLIQKAEGRS